MSSSYRSSSRNSALAFLACLVLSGCVATKSNSLPMRTSNYKVSVSSDGRQVSDFREPLVHYIALSPVKVNALRKSWKAHHQSYLHSKTENDSAGYTLGVRIIASSDNSVETQLGFRVGDLLTAVNKDHAQGPQDLQRLFNTLAKGQKGSITLMRNGKPHKIFYRKERS